VCSGHMKDFSITRLLKVLLADPQKRIQMQSDGNTCRHESILSYPIQSYDIHPESDPDYDYEELYYGRMITKRWR